MSSRSRPRAIALERRPRRAPRAGAPRGTPCAAASRSICGGDAPPRSASRHARAATASSSSMLAHLALGGRTPLLLPALELRAQRVLRNRAVELLRRLAQLALELALRRARAAPRSAVRSISASSRLTAQRRLAPRSRAARGGPRGSARAARRGSSKSPRSFANSSSSAGSWRRFTSATCTSKTACLPASRGVAVVVREAHLHAAVLARARARSSCSSKPVEEAARADLELDAAAAAALEGLAVDAAHEVDREHVAALGRGALRLLDDRRVAHAQPLELAHHVVVADLHRRLAAGQTLELGQLDRRLHLDVRDVAELGVRPRRRGVDRGARSPARARVCSIARAERLAHQRVLDLLGERGAVQPLEHRRAAPCPAGSP